MQLFQLEERLRGVATWADAQPWPAVFRPVDSGGCPQDDQDIDQETGEHYPRDGYPARSMSLGPPRSFPDTPIKRPRPPPPPPQQHRIEHSVPPRASTWCCFPQKKPPPMLRAQGPPRHGPNGPEHRHHHSATDHASSWTTYIPRSINRCPHWLCACIAPHVSGLFSTIHRPLSDRAWCRADAKRMARLEAAARLSRQRVERAAALVDCLHACTCLGAVHTPLRLAIHLASSCDTVCS